MKRLLLLSAQLGLLLLSSCRMATVGKDMPSDQPSNQGADQSGKTPIVQPQQTTKGFAKAIGVMLSETGELKGRPFMKLDYLPESKPGGISKATCYESIAAHLVVGRIECAADVTNTKDVQAKHFDQICFISSTEPRVKATETLKLPGCSGGATLQLYKFSPELQVEIQN